MKFAALLLVLLVGCGPNRGKSQGNLVMVLENVHSDRTRLPDNVGGGYVFAADVSWFADGLNGKATVDPGSRLNVSFAGCPREILVILPQAPPQQGGLTPGGPRLFRKGIFPYAGNRLMVRFPP